MSMAGLSSKEIVFVGPFHFPDNSATTRRIVGIGLSLQKLGHRVIVGSGQIAKMANSYQGADEAQFLTYSLNEFPPKNSHKLLKLIKAFALGQNTLRWLKSLTPRPGVVFLFGGYSPYSRLLIPWCKKNNIPLVVDVVEWFQPSHLPGGWGSFYHLNIEMALRYYYVQAQNLIVISRYLEKYYQGKRCHTTRIPPTLDVQMILPRRSWLDQPLTLAYAGFPGKKDYLENVIEAILQVDLAGQRVRLAIAGPDPQTILRMQPFQKRKLSTLPGSIEARGLLAHEKVVEMVRNADFVPLLRPPLRYAQAGFPTKVPESLAVGTPVICNLTSDLGEYIHDGAEGIICQDYTVEAFKQALEKALSMTQAERIHMRSAAREQAERAFDYRVYAEPLDAFLKELRACV